VSALTVRADGGPAQRAAAGTTACLPECAGRCHEAGGRGTTDTHVQARRVLLRAGAHPRGREVGQQEKEHDFRVYKEVMWDEMAEPDVGTDEERYRLCTPFPFEINMTLPDAQLDFELHIDSFKNFIYYSPSAPRRAQPVPLGCTAVSGLQLAGVVRACGRRQAPVLTP